MCILKIKLSNFTEDITFSILESLAEEEKLRNEKKQKEIEESNKYKELKEKEKNNNLSNEENILYKKLKIKYDPLSLGVI